jgi:hypothetical protein
MAAAIGGLVGGVGMEEQEPGRGDITSPGALPSNTMIPYATHEEAIRIKREWEDEGETEGGREGGRENGWV